MVIRKHHIYFLWYILLVTGCTTVQHISKTDVSYTIVNKDRVSDEDAEVNAMILPYKVQLDVVMNEVIGTLAIDLTKQKPESTLGNWVSDVIVERMQEENYIVDFAVVNYGGLRVPYLTAGPLTTGEIFELSPFDNTMMLVDVPGYKLDSFFLLIAESGGWPVSKEVRMVIKNKKVISANIKGQPIEPDKIYKMATVDYVANGGDNMKVLIPLSRKETGLIFRDILLDYAKSSTEEGKSITSTLDGRITIQSY